MATVTGVGGHPCTWCDWAKQQAEAHGGEIRQELQEFRELTGHYPGCPHGRRRTERRRSARRRPH